MSSVVLGLDSSVMASMFFGGNRVVVRSKTVPRHSTTGTKNWAPLCKSMDVRPLIS